MSDAENALCACPVEGDVYLITSVITIHLNFWGLKMRSVLHLAFSDLDLEQQISVTMIQIFLL